MSFGTDSHSLDLAGAFDDPKTVDCELEAAWLHAIGFGLRTTILPFSCEAARDHRERREGASDQLRPLAADGESNDTVVSGAATAPSPRMVRQSGARAQVPWPVLAGWHDPGPGTRQTTAAQT